MRRRADAAARFPFGFRSVVCPSFARDSWRALAVKLNSSRAAEYAAVVRMKSATVNERRRSTGNSGIVKAR